MILLATLLLALQVFEGVPNPATIPVDQLHDFDSHTCTPARVEWLDAMIVTRATSDGTSLTAADLDASIPFMQSWGCANKTENAVVIIHSFSRGEPDDYLLVPKGWVKTIVPLQLTPLEPEPTGKPPALHLSQR